MNTINFDLVDFRINKIKNIWEHFILEYRFCSSKIKFTEDVQSNYFSDIIGYFSDTNTLIINHYGMEKSDDKFSSAICFLQSIYIQQDFIEELLSIFKCKISKGILKKDDNYRINREIRNELVGHPIRKLKSKNGKQIVISSTLFHFRESEKDKIVYLRYHHENEYEQELVSVNKKEILSRHINFLNRYLDIIISTLVEILDKFQTHIKQIETKIQSLSFERIIIITNKSYEKFYSFHRLYNLTMLKIIWAKRNEHERYQNLVDHYYETLKNSIRDDLSEIKNCKKMIPKRLAETKLPKFTIEYIDEVYVAKVRGIHKVTYNYELSKLSQIRPYQDFIFFSTMLESKCKKKPNVLKELNHMKNNLDNEIEYYCSYYLIAKWLKY